MTGTVAHGREGRSTYALRFIENEGLPCPLCGSPPPPAQRNYQPAHFGKPRQTHTFTMRGMDIAGDCGVILIANEDQQDQFRCALRELGESTHRTNRPVRWWNPTFRGLLSKDCDDRRCQSQLPSCRVGRETMVHHGARGAWSVPTMRDWDWRERHKTGSQ